MSKTAETIYLFLAWWIKAHGYAPPKTTIASMTGVSDLQIDKWLNELANRGFIRLYRYPDGTYNADIMIDPTRPWLASLFLDTRGEPTRLMSEIPIQLHVFKQGQPRASILLSERDLIKEQLKKQGVIK